MNVAEKSYPIHYLGKTYNTSIHKDLTDEEFETIKRDYYAKPPKEEVLKQLKKISEGGMKLNHITSYYVKDLMAKTKVHFNNWTIEEALNHKPLIEFFAGKCAKNEKVFPPDKPLSHNIETAFRLCGFKTASKPANFPIKSADAILQKYDVNGNYYDFSCGWGVRLLSSLRNGLNYYGTDPNYILCERLNNLAADYKSVCQNDCTIDIRAHGSEQFVPEWENTIGLAFTSPPYFNLEDYRIGEQSWKEGTSYEDWKRNYLEPTLRNVYRYLIQDGVMAININNFSKYNDYDLIGDTIDMAKAVGFEFENTHDLKNITRCYGNKNDKGNAKFYDNNEKIFVFRKTDSRGANMWFYDFEVFEKDWLCVFINPSERKTETIINDKEALEAFYKTHRGEIHVGYNCRNYDQWIYKGILAGFNPKKINDFIILQGRRGWEFSNVLRQFSFINYDVYQNIDRGLKFFEGSLGNDIQETSVPFDIDRKLTEDEIAEVVKYCTHDVEQTIAVFLERKADFEAQMGLLKMFDLPLSDLGKTKPQLSAKILGASKKTYHDEFDIDIPETLHVEKYSEVVEWYQNPVNRKYTIDPNDEKSHKNVLKIDVAGVPHVFGWGGVHGALEKYHGEGYFINMDVASLYPSLMIQYNLHSRSCNPEKFTEIYHSRLKYKAEKNPLQAPLKIVLNSTYGAMKDKYNPLYDPRQANRVCVHGQLLLLDLMEHLEPFCEIIQSNTDGVLIKMPDDVPASFLISDYEKRCDAFYTIIDEIAYEWEKRTGLKLEFEEFSTIYQKDVNNYVMVAPDGSYKSKGGYVKKLGNLDYDLAIVNKAVTEYLLHKTPVEATVNACNDLKAFQMVARCSGKYSGFLHGDKPLNERTVRVFASKDSRDKGLTKIHATTGKPAKVASTPERCFVLNEDINGLGVSSRLDKSWYVDLASKRLIDFGVRTNETIQGIFGN